MNIKDSLTKARIQLLLERCFWGNLALHLPLVENNNIPTFATDGNKIYYNKKFAEGLSNTDQQFIIAHEIAHCIFHHLSRRGDREELRWNLAIDYATNAILKKEFGYVPEGGLYSDKYVNMSAEDIYDKLPEMKGDKGNNSYKIGKNGDHTIEVDAKGNIKVDGQDIKSYDTHNDFAGTKEEIDEKEKDWSIQTSKAWQQSKMIGKLPAGMDIFIEQLLQPKLDWRNLLRQFVVQTAKSDYSWRTPNRRYLHEDMYMPSVTDESLGDIVVIVDNSGSVLEDQKRFFSECNGLLRQYEVDMHLITCDADVQSYKVYNQGDTIDLNQKGGGGTDMRKAFEYIREKRINPNVIVCLTDGYTPFPEKETCPTLWVLCKNSVSLDDIPFGIKVRVE